MAAFCVFTLSLTSVMSLLVLLWIIVVKASLASARWPALPLYSSNTAGFMGAELLSDGLTSAFQECQRQFKWERWGCPRKDFDNKSKGVATSDTREGAFIHAILSASVTHAATISCARGDLPGLACTCRVPTPRKNISSETLSSIKTLGSSPGNAKWQLEGCSQDLEIGAMVAEEVLERPLMGQDARGRIRRHNMKAGRLAVQTTTQRRCKCHGVSGSCATQTCWLQLGSLQDAGRILKQQYRKALQLHGGNALLSEDPQCKDGRCREPQERPSHPPDISVTVKPQELVFLEDSIDFCVARTKEGTKGTVGRECSRSRDPEVALEERRSCQTLCRSCGFGVSYHTLEVTKTCNCKFVWCCTVECESCVETEKRYWCSRD